MDIDQGPMVWSMLFLAILFLQYKQESCIWIVNKYSAKLIKQNYNKLGVINTNKVLDSNSEYLFD